MSAQSNCAATTRPQAHWILTLAAVAAITGANTGARASNTDTEHLFGLTEGADIGKAARRRARPSPASARRPGLTRRSHKTTR
jgi:hypothetical protein